MVPLSPSPAVDRPSPSTVSSIGPKEFPESELFDKLILPRASNDRATEESVSLSEREAGSGVPLFPFGLAVKPPFGTFAANMLLG
jgi:hypothetical protein